MIQVVVKGSAKNAKREASRRGIPLRNCRIVRKFNEAICDAPCGKLTAVMNWHGDASRTKTGRGFAPGTMTFFSQGRCEAKALRGGTPKRRKRRRR